MEQREKFKKASPAQRKKLVALLAQHPQLNDLKVTSDFTYQDSRKLWQRIASECNALPGAEKTWRQWRKTWQDIKSKSKKRQKTDDNLDITLSNAQEALVDINNLGGIEFIQLESEITQESQDKDLSIEMNSNDSLSEPESILEPKVFVKNHKIKNRSSTSNGLVQKPCEFNCDLLALTEERKVKNKEDYYNFKKDYLRQKLELLREQTEALKNIAKALSEK